MPKDIFLALRRIPEQLGLGADQFSAFEKSNYPTYILSYNGDFVYVNEAFARYTENPEQKLLKLNTDSIRDTFEPSIREIVISKHGEASVFQEIVTAKKHRRFQLTIGKPIFDSWGNMTHVLVIIAPVPQQSSDRALAESASDALKTSSFKPIDISKSMQRALKLAKKASYIDCPVLLTGDSGTGKTYFAKYIHDISSRKDGPFVTVNCAGDETYDVESELFGIEDTNKTGAIERAKSGTLFLDEINALPMSTQTRLLRVLENGKVSKIGSNKEVPIDVRIVSAANESLDQMCDNKLFRRDLFYEITLLHIDIPPLKERRDDIIPIARNFLDELCAKYGMTKIFSPVFYEFLIEYDWPGNIRELRNAIEQSYLISEESDLMLKIPIAYLDKINHRYAEEEVSARLTKAFSLPDYLDEVEAQTLRSVAKQCNSTYELAELCGINQSTAVRKLKKYGIDINDLDSGEISWGAGPKYSRNT